MARVLCTLPHASERINDVAFEATADGMLSEMVSDEVAASFALIPGYKLVVERRDAAPQPAVSEEASGEAATHHPAKMTRRKAN